MNQASVNKIVCCADVLGFSAKFSALSTNEKRDEYSLIIEAVKSACHSIQDYRREQVTYNLKRSNFYWFSDTFILFSKDIPPDIPDVSMEDLLPRFFHSVKMLFLRFLYHGYPLRGGIDYGEFIVDPEENVFLGNALINSYKMSERHKWAGISLTPICSKFIRKYKNQNNLLIEHNVLSKDNTSEKLQVIDWPNDPSIMQKPEADKYVHDQFFHSCTNIDSKVEEYLKNTIDFLKKRRSSTG